MPPRMDYRIKLSFIGKKWGLIIEYRINFKPTFWTGLIFFHRNGIEEPPQVYAALIYACSLATFIRLRDCFQMVLLAEDLVEGQVELSGWMDLVDTDQSCTEVRGQSDPGSKKEKTLAEEGGVAIVEDDWEKVKDIFFMLRLPFEVDMSDNNQGAKERFRKALTSRTRRKNGRYGPPAPSSS